jgi:hypothetical protein
LLVPNYTNCKTLRKIIGSLHFLAGVLFKLQGQNVFGVFISAQQSIFNEIDNWKASQHVHVHEGYSRAAVNGDSVGPPFGHRQTIHSRRSLERPAPRMG